MSETIASVIPQELVDRVLHEIGEICTRYEISALEDFLDSCRAFAEEKLLNVAVLGRFKAGKSTFLNHLLGRPLLPVGVIPVTTVVTEIQYGPRERAEIHYVDGRIEEVPASNIGEYISESENPGNGKGVAMVRVELPSIGRFRGIRFVDTPGLESVLEHNTDASMSWLPNVGLALVAVGVDPPLSQHDVELIQNLSRFTPNISLLLTKVDVLDEAERAQVARFVEKQLARYWKGSVPVYQFSVKPGFEELRRELYERLFSRLSSEAGEQHAAILRHKLDSLISECVEYLHVALKSAEVTDTERAQLRHRILGEKEALEDTRLALRLIARHAAGSARPMMESILKKDEQGVRQRLLARLEAGFPAWTRSLATAMVRFDGWLQVELTAEMAELSKRHREEFVGPVQRVARQLSQSLQDFRNRLSERTLEALGVPLRTTEMEISTPEPRSPDVRVGKIFDRNWELLSFLIPMPLVRGMLKRHFRHKTADAVSINLSRLVSQWEEIVRASLAALEKEAIRRLDSLIGTIEKMITSAPQVAPRIREDLNRLELLREELWRGQSPEE